VRSSFWYGGSAECRHEDGWVGQWEGAKTAATSLFLCAILTLLALAIALDAWLRTRAVLWLPGAVTTMLLGLACGAVLRLTHDAELQRLLE
jgi:hypothetical protein